MLHTINKSPFEKSTLFSCFRIADLGSDILLIEDGVYAAMMNTQFEDEIRECLDKFQLYVLDLDLQCRGIQHSELIPGIETVNYEGFVQLAVKNDSVHCWL